MVLLLAWSKCTNRGDLDGDLADSQPRDANTEGDRPLVSPPRNTLTKHSQNRDEDRIPELLGANNLVTVGSERAIRIGAVDKRDEDPDADNAEPARKAVMALEEAVDFVSIIALWRSAQQRTCDDWRESRVSRRSW